jgi:hypothetical protein
MRVLLLLALVAGSASAYDKEGGAPVLSTATLAVPIASTAAPSAAPFAAAVPSEAGTPAPGPASRSQVRAGYAQIFGSHDYVGASALVEASVSSWSVRTGFREYESGSSTGPFLTLSGRGGWTDGRLSVGIIGEVTPSNQGYRSRAFGADLGWAWRPAGKPGPVKRVAILGSVVRTSHSSDLPATKNLPATTSDIGQSDIAGSASVTVRKASFSAGFKKSVYNLDGADLTQSTSRVLTLSNFDAVVTGLPQDEYWLRASWDDVGLGLSPSVAWTKTNYKVLQAPSAAVQAGLTRDFARWSASAFYGRLSERGQADRAYAGFGANLKF